MESYYEINIAKKIGENYFHYFATAPRSINTEQKLNEILPVIEEKFPFPEYHVTVAHWEATGTIIKD